MTIEIADRLIKLRKKYGYSQEELADKLGLSRQAVSKWERAEASPDTDNLICLAKLYGVSLDELLSTDEDIDTIIEEQVKKEESKEKEPKDEVKKEGIHVVDDDGSEVIIDDDGVKVINEDGKKVNIKKQIESDPVIRVVNIVEGALFFLATIAYILLGVFLNMWYNAWVVFFVPEILCSIPRAIRKKNANNFNMAFTAIFAFFFVCMVYPGLEAMLWHPMWVVFLAIPAYHVIVSSINKAIGKKDEDDKEGND